MLCVSWELLLNQSSRWRNRCVDNVFGELFLVCCSFVRLIALLTSDSFQKRDMVHLILLLLLKLER